MNTFGNIIWLLFGGFLVALGYFFGGIVLCLTIIGIPFGYQTMKLGAFALWPFGRTTVVDERGSGCLSTFMNILWLLTGGLSVSITHLVFGLLLCITIIGIPWGRQHFKLMAMALTPFGRVIVPAE